MSKLRKADKRTVLKWTKALRSGEFTQTAGYLQDDSGFCCLGVACKVFTPKNKQILNRQGLLKGAMPDDQISAPKWLKTLDDHFYDLTGESLPDLNDDKKFTFNEIADVLEAVYIHKVL